MSNRWNYKVWAGSVLIAATICVGFMPVDHATWLAWRGVWTVGAGLSIGCGLALLALGVTYT